jgi:hypothetical protein
MAARGSGPSPSPASALWWANPDQPGAEAHDPGRPHRGRDRAGRVTVSVPDRGAMALETTSGCLGILGGISTLGTSGIVDPVSTASYRASVVQQIDVAAAQGERIVRAIGARTEAAAAALYPGLDPVCLIEVGDFAGIALRRAAHAGIRKVVFVGAARRAGSRGRGASGGGGGGDRDHDGSPLLRRLYGFWVSGTARPAVRACTRRLPGARGVELGGRGGARRLRRIGRLLACRAGRLHQRECLTRRA